jgi:hypothetical protein
MAIWNLHKATATLSDRALSGIVNLESPATGLHQLAIEGQPIAVQAALGLLLDPVADAIEAYARSTDLVATYPESPSRPTRAQVYWKLADGLGPLGVAYLLDMQVSVQTSALDVPVPMSTLTLATASEVLRLTSSTSCRFEPLSLGAEHCLSPKQGPGCLLLRHVGQAWSYVEMIHPADFHDDELRSSPLDSSGLSNCQITHRLFPEALEKGVILRSQVRGALAPRDDDQRIAAALYDNFISLPPPLTT